MLMRNFKATREDVYDQVPTSDYLAEQAANEYFRGDYRLGLNLYSLHHNLMSWLTRNTSGAPAIDTLEAIRFAADAGFDTVDVTSYYIPGYGGHVPMRDRSEEATSIEEVYAYVASIRQLCDDLGILISGTGIRNDFADPDNDHRAFDLRTVKKWTDVAAEMGAPVIRVFSGLIPEDIDELGWERIARARIVPALRECVEYGAAKGVMIGVQNHGDMMSTADQVIRILRWVDHPNLGVVNDTGYFRRFNESSPTGYRWFDDIEAVLPYSVNFQIKQRPAGADPGVLMDLEELFTRIRSSTYRGPVPFEMIWEDGDPNHPDTLEDPPYQQISAFLSQVRAAAESTKTTG